MFRRFVFCLVMTTVAVFACFGQASNIRDYVGMISQTFHPDIVSFMEKFKSDLEKHGYSAAARSVDTYLKGESGTGFVYVSGGRSYIITNYHVISQAYTLSVTFEKLDGGKTKFSDLTIIAADEEMDIALLAFAGGQNPFRDGLSFYTQTLQEGDDVYSAGFPGLGNTLVWQLGRGMVSNASVRLPEREDSDKMLGPFVQHTAQVDPGNSGGPLLVRTEGVPTGFAVAGINTRSARSRQAANFSIPLSRVQEFLDASLITRQRDELAQLNARVASFIEGLRTNKTVYTHIAPYLSNNCTGENAEYALWEMLDKATSTVKDEIVQAFAYSPVDGMTYAVAWTIENALRSRNGQINISANSVTAVGNGNYTVAFNVNGKTINSEWVNEYGIWRIRKFGDFAAGDKTLLQRKANASRLVSNPIFRISALFAMDMEHNRQMYGAELKFSGGFLSYGFEGYFGEGLTQIEFLYGFHIPIRAGGVAFTPFGDFSMGARFLPITENDRFPSFLPFNIEYGISFKGGLMFTTSVVPGLYIQAAYKYNIYPLLTFERKDDGMPKGMLVFGIGYSF